LALSPPFLSHGKKPINPCSFLYISHRQFIKTVLNHKAAANSTSNCPQPQSSRHHQKHPLFEDMAWLRFQSFVFQEE
jgi:hypothetical protein